MIYEEPRFRPGGDRFVEIEFGDELNLEVNFRAQGLGRAIAERLFGAARGGMMTVKVRGDAAGMYAFTNATRLCSIGVSLGDLFTLVYPNPKRGDIIRVSTGCEEIEDILADVTQALDAVPVPAAR